MIRTERLHIVPLNYYELLSYVYSYSGMVSNDEELNNVVEYSLRPMKEAPEHLKKWYTFWLGYYEGQEVLQCGFICPPTEHQVVEVFCYTNKEFQKQGFGTEAIKGLVRFSESYDNIKYVCASVAKDNEPSKKMLKKNDFYYLQDTPSGMMVFNKQIKN